MVSLTSEVKEQVEEGAKADPRSSAKPGGPLRMSSLHETFRVVRHMPVTCRFVHGGIDIFPELVDPNDMSASSMAAKPEDFSFHPSKEGAESLRSQNATLIEALTQPTFPANIYLLFAPRWTSRKASGGVIFFPATCKKDLQVQARRQTLPACPNPLCLLYVAGLAALRYLIFSVLTGPLLSRLLPGIMLTSVGFCFFPGGAVTQYTIGEHRL